MLTLTGLRAPERALPRLLDAPGTTLELMVVSTGQCHCAGIDLASGALVRAWSQQEVDSRLRPYDVVKVTIGGDAEVVPDPAEPEAVVVSGQPALVDRLRGRKAIRLIRPLLHPERSPLLGFTGATVPFWQRSADHPSVTIASPLGPLVVTRENRGLWCHFLWDGRPQVLACGDPRLAASMARMRVDQVDLRPGTFMVVALEPPVEGQCHKVVESLVPRR